MADTDLGQYRSLDPVKVHHTAVLLLARIRERFPNAGLAKVCAELVLVSEQALQRAAWIARPHRGVRFFAAGMIAGSLLIVVQGFLRFSRLESAYNFAEFVQMVEALINDVVLIGAALFFFVTLEMRIKRKRALKALHELRVMAHIIDMHQLTKDPERLLPKRIITKSSPKEALSLEELRRYLDYCSEMLAVIGKIAALYAQHLDDAVVLDAVNEIETLTSSLSRKVWQKLMILFSLETRVG